MNDSAHSLSSPVGLLTLLFLGIAGCAENSTNGSVATGETCTSEDDCADGLSCGANNGACFSGARSERRCWPASCADDFYFREECGELTSRCGPVCGCATACDLQDPTTICPSDEQCIYNFGRLFDIGSRDACGDARCPSNDPALCGDPFKLCGPNCICTPDCSQATPSNPDDGCGELCPEVCPIGMKGCCTSDYECVAGGACLSDPDGARTCRPTDCVNQALVPPLCGTADALCGPECPICTPQCGAMTCGPDPNCGMSCGTCADSEYCNAGGQCTVVPPDGETCEGESVLQGALVVPRESTEEPPVPEGGVIPDATFDLMEILVHGQSAPAPASRRTAFRFFDGARQAEYVVEIPENTEEPPRRLLRVNVATATQLQFVTSCPFDPLPPELSFVRGFTITQTGLLLFDGTTEFVFTRR